jgi:uncharacterized protein (DUF2147 family)
MVLMICISTVIIIIVCCAINFIQRAKLRKLIKKKKRQKKIIKNAKKNYASSQIVHDNFFSKSNKNIKWHENKEGYFQVKSKYKKEYNRLPNQLECKKKLIKTQEDYDVLKKMIKDTKIAYDSFY